jgi:hypothetical protein
MAHAQPQCRQLRLAPRRARREPVAVASAALDSSRSLGRHANDGSIPAMTSSPVLAAAPVSARFLVHFASSAAVVPAWRNRPRHVARTAYSVRSTQYRVPFALHVAPGGRKPRPGWIPVYAAPKKSSLAPRENALSRRRTNSLRERTRFRDVELIHSTKERPLAEQEATLPHPPALRFANPPNGHKLLNNSY